VTDAVPFNFDDEVRRQLVANVVAQQSAEIDATLKAASESEGRRHLHRFVAIEPSGAVQGTVRYVQGKKQTLARCECGLEAWR